MSDVGDSTRDERDPARSPLPERGRWPERGTVLVWVGMGGALVAALVVLAVAGMTLGEGL